MPTPAQVAAASDEQLRAVGLSGQKIGYMRDLCRADRRRLAAAARRSTRMPDDEVIAALTQVKGIGRWTAEMFLMFRLHRPDVLPVGDLGIVKAVQKAYRLRKVPTPERLTRIGESWRPYRSVACWYLWASLDNKPLTNKSLMTMNKTTLPSVCCSPLALVGAGLASLRPRRTSRPSPTCRGSSSRSTRCRTGSR